MRAYLSPCRRTALAATVLLSLCAGLPAATALAAPPAPGPAAAPFTLGGAQLFALRDASFMAKNDGKTFGVGPDVGPQKVAAILTAAGASPDQIPLAVDALLVKTSGSVLLFDTGVGGALLQSLALAGVRPEEVTDVFITHSHFDHVGGLAGPGGLRFPNAVIHMSAREWTFLKSQPQNAKLVLAISPKVRPFEPGETLAPGVRAIPLYGHTPGHVAYEIMSGDQRLLDIGDLAHSSIVSLARPDWAMAYDQDQVAGAATRVRTLDRLASNKTLIFAPHFPFPGIGTIERDGAGYVFTPKAP